MYIADPYYLKGYTDRKDHGEAFRGALKLVFNAAINVDADSIRKVSFTLREKMKEELKKDPSKAKFTKEEAEAEVAKLIKEKTKKGYIEKPNPHA